jgi:two-component system NarL family sensor kinase
MWPKPKTALPTLLFLLLQLAVFAQDTTIDSLRATIGRTTNDNAKLKAYILLTGRLSLISFNETIKVGEEGLLIASRLNDSVSYAELTRYLGMANYFKGDYEKAAAYYFTATGIYERRSMERQLATIINDIAKLYRKTRDLKRALSFYNSALELFTKLKDSSGIQMIMNESGVVYEYQGNYDEAIRHYNAALQIATKLNDEAGKGWCYNFLAGVYGLQSKFEQAEDHNLRALAIRQKLKDTFALAFSYADMGVMYGSWNKYERAVYYLEESIKLAERMQYREMLSNNYAELSRIANVTGDYKKALDYYTWHTQLKDSIFNAQKTRQIEELSTLYETNKKEQQIEVQQLTIKKQTTQIFFILCFVAFAAVIAFLLYNRYRWKQQAKLQSEILKQQELAAQSILEAEEKERTRIAKDLHDGVGQMMSAARMNLSSFYNTAKIEDGDQSRSLVNIIQLVDDSCKEVRAVSHSMMPSALLNKGLSAAVEELTAKISNKELPVSLYSQGFSERLNTTTETILFRVIQECINNSIKHAEASTLHISLIHDNDGVSITIEDNGKGFSKDRQQNEDGMGLSNIKSRIQFLKGTVDIDSSPGNGTLVAIHVPTQQHALK